MLGIINECIICKSAISEDISLRHWSYHFFLLFICWDGWYNIFRSALMNALHFFLVRFIWVCFFEKKNKIAILTNKWVKATPNALASTMNDRLNLLVFVVLDHADRCHMFICLFRLSKASIPLMIGLHCHGSFCDLVWPTQMAELKTQPKSMRIQWTP